MVGVLSGGVAYESFQVYLPLNLTAFSFVLYRKMSFLKSSSKERI